MLDLAMPDSSGYELAREIRARLGKATPLLIALSGYGQSDDFRRTHAAGFDVHLVKPVDPEAVLTAIQGAPRTVTEPAR